MSVAAYTLRIREHVGDDSRWQETRIVAASLAQALAKAQQRFGEERVMAVSQDVVGEPLTDAEQAEAYDGPVVPEPIPDPQIVHAHDPSLFEPDSRADAFVAAVVEAGPVAPPRAPMPWEGRWRPSNLIWIGVAAGLVAFTFWYQFGAPARDRFVTAAPATAQATSGLALGDVGPRGGALAASGVRLRRGDDDAMAIGEMVGESMAGASGEDEAELLAGDGEDGDDAAVRTIGTLVGDIFSRWPDESNESADEPPYRIAQPDDVVGAPQAALPPNIAARETAVLQPFFVGVDRGGGVIETLRVPAYDADHARAIVADLPERPIIVRGPSAQLDW